MILVRLAFSIIEWFSFLCASRALRDSPLGFLPRRVGGWVPNQATRPQRIDQTTLTGALTTAASACADAAGPFLGRMGVLAVRSAPWGVLLVWLKLWLRPRSTPGWKSESWSESCPASESESERICLCGGAICFARREGLTLPMLVGMVDARWKGGRPIGRAG